MSADNEAVERRLEDALAELAATTAFQDDAWDRITRRRGRHISGRWLGGGAIVVAAAAAIAFTFAITIDDDPSRVTTTPTTSRASTTTEQYASVIREHSAAIQEWIDSEKSCRNDLDCYVWPRVRERYIALRLDLTYFDQALGWLPSPPNEIATLVDSTKKQLNDAVNTIDLMLSCQLPPPPARVPCSDAKRAAEAAYKRLPPLFAAWSPYT